MRHILICCLLILLTGCGFHLAGYEPWPPQLQKMAVLSNNPYGRFTVQLERNLSSAGIDIDDTAAYQLHIVDTDMAYDTNDYGPSNQARIYSFVYTIRASITTASGKVIMPLESFATNRQFTFSANQLVETNDETKLLQMDMQRELINQLMNRITSQQIRDKLDNAAKAPSPSKKKHKTS